MDPLFDRPIAIFLNRKNAENYQCAICRSVFTEATSIGCKQDDTFCKKCLEKYFANNKPKQCPSCRQRGLTKNNVRSCKYIDRVINSEKVKCILQYRNTMQDNVSGIDCKWSGDLLDLAKHVNIDCALYEMVCDDCNRPIRRYDTKKHSMFCLEKKLLCAQGCNEKITRKKMKFHKLFVCVMAKMTCDECKTDVLRKDMSNHKRYICTEHEIQCPYYEYGCDAKIKRNSMHEHVRQQQVNHLGLKVSYLEQQLRTIDIENKKIFMITRSNRMHIAYLKSKNTKSSLFTSTRHSYHYCVAKNVSYQDSVKMGFDRSILSVFGNDIIFHISKKGVTNIHIDSMTAMHVPIPIDRTEYRAIHHKSYGFLLVGGIDPQRNGVKDICSVDINDYSKSLVNNFKIPDFRRNPSLCLSVDQNLLFMCGGAACPHKGEYLSSCCAYNFPDGDWTYLKNMNHGHYDAPIYLWRKRGDKIIVASGYSNKRCLEVNTFVEEYDQIKDVWIDLPKLHNKHESNSAFFEYNNALFCIF